MLNKIYLNFSIKKLTLFNKITEYDPIFKKSNVSIITTEVELIICSEYKQSAIINISTLPLDQLYCVKSPDKILLNGVWASPESTNF